MPKNSSTKFYDKTIMRTVDLERFSEGERRRILKLLRNTQLDIIAEIVKQDPASIVTTRRRKRRLLRLNREIGKIIDKDYGRVKKTNNSNLKELSINEANQTVKNINDSIGIDLASVTISEENLKSIVDNSLIDGKTIGEWWDGQSQEFKDRFSAQMADATQAFQIGTVRGSSVDELVKRVRGTITKPGMFNKVKKDVKALVRTATMQVANESRAMMYQANEDLIEGYEIVATLDTRTTPLCRDLDGRKWKIVGREPLRRKQRG